MANQNTTFPSTTKRPPTPQGRRQRPFVRTAQLQNTSQEQSPDHVPLHAVQECAVLDCHHKLLYPKHNFEECQCSGRGWQLNSDGGRVSSVIVRCTTRECTDKPSWSNRNSFPMTFSETLRKPQGCEEQDQTRDKSITSSLSASHLRSKCQ